MPSRHAQAIRESFEPGKRRYDITHGFDMSLRADAMNDYVETVRTNLRKTVPKTDLFTMGHIGDNNIHFSVAGVTTEEMGPVNNIIYEPLRALNGSVSAEHGIGLEKKPYLNISRTPEELTMMQRIKTLFDPNNILNPGKIFDL